MPIYTRKCAQCGHTEDHLEQMEVPMDEERKCPACGHDEYLRIMAPTAPNFKTLEEQCRGKS